MSIWNEIAERVVPDYNNQIYVRNKLKRQYQQELQNLENDEPISLPTLSEGSEVLGDKVYTRHLKARKAVENSGHNSKGQWHISDSEKVNEEMNEVVESINRANKVTGALRFFWIVLLLFSFIIALYIGVFGLNSLISNIQTVSGNNTTTAFVFFFS